MSILALVSLASCSFDPPGLSTAVEDTVTVIFQQELNGYAGTQDSELRESDTTRNRGNDQVIEWDIDNGRYALLRFDDIVGSSIEQIPAGATIVSATLTLTMIDDSELPAGSVHAVLVPWDEETVTFDNFGAAPGVQSDDYGPRLASAPVDMGANDVVLTDSVQAWADSPTDNLGWIFVAGSQNGAKNGSSESSPSAQRPRLTVEYLP